MHAVRIIASYAEEVNGPKKTICRRYWMSVGGGDGGGAEVSRLEAAQKLVRAHTHKLSSSNP